MASDAAAALPWEGMNALSRLWSGSGDLYDWLVGPSWQISRRWSSGVVRARALDVYLRHLREVVLDRLPPSRAAWLDMLERDMRRTVEVTPYPSATTDWAATVSTYGRLPAPAYVGRQRHWSFDTAFTRVLRWWLREVFECIDIVRSVVERGALPDSETARLRDVASIEEVRAAREVELPDVHDLRVCDAEGGVRQMVATEARLLAGLRPGSVMEQVWSLRAIMPAVDDDLFELGVLGTVAAAIDAAMPVREWVSRTPLAAVQTGVPTLEAADSATAQLYYQTVPFSAAGAGPYEALGRAVGAGRLRPDMWLVAFSAEGQRAELVIECKYTLAQDTITAGIVQLLAYGQEYLSGEPRRRYALVCPDGSVPTPRPDRSLPRGPFAHGAFELLTPSQLRQRISDLISGLV